MKQIFDVHSGPIFDKARVQPPWIYDYLQEKRVKREHKPNEIAYEYEHCSV